MRYYLKKPILIYTVIRFLLLSIPYFSWFAVYVNTDYRGLTYNLDAFILYPFFFVYGIIFLESIWHIYKKDKQKYIINLSLLIFFASLYFILPHKIINQLK